MRKALFLLMCLAAMMAVGTGLRAQEVSTSLLRGWNWISYPNADTMELSQALSNFTPAEGDVIKSKGLTSSYRGGTWRGTLKNVIPGAGYHYKSVRDEAVTFSFSGQQPASQATVTTEEPTSITIKTAVLGCPDSVRRSAAGGRPDGP